MGLSEAMLFAFAATIICAFAIAEKIIDIDFEQFMPKNLKKAKMKRILAKRETPLQGARLQKDIKDSFENVLLPLGKADKGYLPKRMDLTFRRKMVHQVELLGKRKLCRDIQVTDVVPLPKNNFKRWNDDGREWRESILQCSSLERLISPQAGKTVHQIYRKNSYLRILQSRHIRHSDRQGKNKEFYSDKGTILCPSCGAEVELSSQQVICPYCGGVIQSEFYDWQTEAFEIYEKMGANMQYGLLLLAYSGIMFLCLTLCLYLIKDTDISLTIGVIATLLILKNVVNTDKTTEITATAYGSETYLPESGKPYTKKTKTTLVLQRARYPERRKTDGAFFKEKDCPSCGANFIPDEHNCCSFCGYSFQADNAKWVVKATGES